MTLPEAYKSQVQHIQPSPKYDRQPDGQYQPAAFPGYTVITPPWGEETHNQEFYDCLQAFQQQVGQQLGSSLLVPVPPDSFHLTLADLIWNSAYRHASENPDFEVQLRDRISQSFQQCQAQVAGEPPIYWQVLGLIVMPRAIGVCLAPKDEGSHDRILRLRRAIYQSQDVIALGIEQQYHFTAHITLGYFGDVSAVSDREALSNTLTELTQQWQHSGSPQALWVHRAELRKFDDMSRYYREPDWAILEF